MKLWVLVFHLFTAESEQPIAEAVYVVADGRDCIRAGEWMNERAIEYGGYGRYQCIPAPILSTDGKA